MTENNNSVTNLNNNLQKDDMQSHIDKVYGFLDDFLPEGYMKQVREKLIGDNPSDETIRKVRSEKKRGLKKPHILEALVSVAVDNKETLIRLSNLITKTNNHDNNKQALSGHG